jgi:hypothetical protein
LDLVLDHAHDRLCIASNAHRSLQWYFDPAGRVVEVHHGYRNINA